MRRAERWSHLASLALASALSFVVALWRSLGHFVNALTSVFEELVRSFFTGAVHALNRGLHGLIPQPRGLRPGEEQQRRTHGSTFSEKGDIRRKTSHSDLFGTS